MYKKIIHVKWFSSWVCENIWSCFPMLGDRSDHTLIVPLKWSSSGVLSHHQGPRQSLSCCLCFSCSQPSELSTFLATNNQTCRVFHAFQIYAIMQLLQIPWRHPAGISCVCRHVAKPSWAKLLVWWFVTAIRWAHLNWEPSCEGIMDQRRRWEDRNVAARSVLTVT